MSDGAAHDEKSTFDGARLLRFAEALDATVEELRALPPGSLTVAELEGIVERTVAEAEAVIPACWYRSCAASSPPSASRKPRGTSA